MIFHHQWKRLWKIITGKVKLPPILEMEQVERDQDDLEPRVRALERAAEFRRWQRERGQHEPR
jgi:hypothetical protein